MAYNKATKRAVKAHHYYPLFCPFSTVLCELMNQPIIGYHKDKENDWVAELKCGHFQHVRNNPPFINRPWVTTEKGRNAMLGYSLNCNKCDLGEPPDLL